MSAKIIKIDFSGVFLGRQTCRLTLFILQKTPYYAAKGYVLHPDRRLLPDFSVCIKPFITVFKTIKDVSVARKYRPQNVKSPYPIARFTNNTGKMVCISNL